MERAFVIQFHTGFRRDHYDLMIENGSALATFELDRRADEIPAGASINVTRLADHRREYLEYEGEISGGRGRVKIADRGRCEGNFEGDKWEFTLDGLYLQASYVLELHGDKTGRLKRL